MEITKEFLEDRIKNFNAEITRLEGLVNHTAGMRDACLALINALEAPENLSGPENPE